MPSHFFTSHHLVHRAPVAPAPAFLAVGSGVCHAALSSALMRFRHSDSVEKVFSLAILMNQDVIKMSPEEKEDILISMHRSAKAHHPHTALAQNDGSDDESDAESDAESGTDSDDGGGKRARVEEKESGALILTYKAFTVRAANPCRSRRGARPTQRLFARTGAAARKVMSRAGL